MPLLWLRQWMRRVFPSRRRYLSQRSRVRPALTPLEDRLLLSVSLNLVVPPSSPYGATNSLEIQYANTGSTAVAAPVLILSADNANLWLPNDKQDSASTLQVLATNPNGPAGTLAPGASGTITVDFTSTSTTNAPINFRLGQLTSGQTIDWSAQEAGLRPSSIPASVWNSVFTNFTTNVGSTTDSYQAALDADATYLAQLGEPTNDVAQLVGYEIAKADDDFGAAPLGSAVDSSVPELGPSLSFTRSFQPTISGRNETGLTGLGWVSNWDISASTDSQGNVTIDQGGALSYFAKQSDGSYVSSAAGSGTLQASAGGGYQLTATDGSITAFNANGTLDYVQDANGNRVTANYNASGQLVALVATNGDTLAFTYSSQGFVSQITAPSGETAKYSYDAAGHLLSVTTPQGTTSYSYVSGTGTPADNALQSILSPTGTQLNYLYDSEGRLTESFFGTAANPLETVTISYLAPGGLTYTDANGNAKTILYNELGQVGAITDSLGNTTQLNYDANGNLTSAVLPGGATYTYTYTPQGNLLSETDALGETTNFTYDSNGNLTSATDPKGNTTSYSYDSSNNLLSVTYANGAQQSYTYNPLGEATQFLNADGQAISYTYNAQGQITGETFADGTSYSFTYDANGNLTSATDAQGQTTTFIYGGDANNPNNPNLLTEIEYPDGSYLHFSYYAGGLRQQSVDQSGFTVNYTYDAAGRLVELTDGNGDPIVQYTYDADGNLIQQDNSNGTSTVTTYDADGRVLSITHLAPNHTAVNSFDTYTYDAQGNVLTDTNQDGQWVYAYDANNELTQAVFTPNNTNPDGLTAQYIQYVYDAAGNRVAETINGVTTTYTVNNVNEDTSSTTAGATTTYQYDLDGNLIDQTTGGSTTTYTYSELNQLTGINGPGLTASYTYDPLGDRLSQTVNGVTTNYQVDAAGNVVAAFNSPAGGSSSLLAHYISGLGLVSQVTNSGTPYYYDFGQAGNTIGVTGTTGSYVDQYSYLPLGQTTALAAAVSNPFTFDGQSGALQDTSNLFDVASREYATTGQFLSANPSGLVGGAANLASPAIDNSLSASGAMGLGFTPSVLASSVTAPGNPVNLLGSPSTATPADLPAGYGTFTVQFVANTAPSLVANGSVSDSGKNETSWVNGSIGFSSSAGTVSQGLYSWENPQGTSPLWTEFDLYASGNSLAPTNQSSIASTVAGLLGSDTTLVTSASTTNTVPVTSTGQITAGSPTTVVVYSGPVSGPITGVNVTFTSPQNPGLPILPTNIVVEPGQGPNQYTIYATVTFPTPGNFGVNVVLNGNDVVANGNQVMLTVFDPPIVINPVAFTAPAGGQYGGLVATFTVLGTNPGLGGFTAWTEMPGSGVQIPATIVAGPGNTFLVYANLDYGQANPGNSNVLVYVVNANGAFANSLSDGLVSDSVDVTSPGENPSTTDIIDPVVDTNGSQSPDGPLAIVDTTDPTIIDPGQINTSVGASANPNAPIPVVTGTTLTQLTGGLTQIVVNGIVSTVQQGLGLVASAPLNITVGNEPSLTTQVNVDETGNAYTVTPVSVSATAGQSLTNVPVATLSGLANGNYTAVINWGDGDTSTGTITPLGNGLFSITGSKPHPYAAAGTDTITVSVTAPGAIVPPPVQTTITVDSTPLNSPPPAPPPPPVSSPPSPPSSPSPEPTPPSSPSSPPPSSSLSVGSVSVSPPPALSLEDQIFAYFDQLVAQIEAEIQLFINFEIALEQEMLAALGDSSGGVSQSP